MYGGLLLGLFFNLVVMVALLYRWLFLPLRPEQLLANHWINMGAFAIVAVSGVKLAALHLRSVPPGATAWSEIPIRPLVIFSWVLATWWVPVLLTAGFWRHALQRVPFLFKPPIGRWSLFSPSVYAMATTGLIAEFHLHALMWVPPTFIVLAGIAWITPDCGRLRALAHPRLASSRHATNFRCVTTLNARPAGASNSPMNPEYPDPWLAGAAGFDSAMSLPLLKGLRRINLSR